ncbi:hypothetical protein [Bradyrhizobium sp. USDA 4452]
MFRLSGSLIVIVFAEGEGIKLAGYCESWLGGAHFVVSCDVVSAVVTGHVVAQLRRECLSEPRSTTAAGAISTYIAAKDRNLPLLMKRAFVPDCELQMQLLTDAISFPSSAHGLENVTDVLVRSFGLQYDNVRTFCLSRPAVDRTPRFQCDWLVGMSNRSDGGVRVGCGEYTWDFDAAGDGRVKRLFIKIELMCVLPASYQAPVLQWLSLVPYPWSSCSEAWAGLPSIDALTPIAQFLRREPRN